MTREGPGALPPVELPASYNYIGLFLTFACSLRCGYCINRFGVLDRGRGTLTGAQWARGINRLVSRPDLPLTLQGGEPTLHPDFSALLARIRPDLNVDLLTNLEIDVDGFLRDVPPGRLRRDAPYASIRVSYHPGVMDIAALSAKVVRLLRAGYSVGIWGVEHPRHGADIARARAHCRALGIDFRTKEFLGECDGVLHGNFRYPGACDRGAARRVECRGSELLVAPSGHVYRCHGDLYEGQDPVGHLLDPALTLATDFRPCDHFGRCNPCDVKVKTNRFQQFGHTSVEIRFP